MDDVPLAWATYKSALEGLDLPSAFFHRVETYLGTLAAVNKTINLISFTKEEELRGHVTDALQVLPSISTPGTLRLIDVGTGGGLPGVPLAIARPSWSITLLDSIKKKQSAVSDMLETTNVKNGVSLWGRAEELGQDKNYRESFDGALCRAVGRFTTVMELTLPLVKIGGAAYLYRGSEGREELAVAKRALKELGGEPGPVYAYRLPGLEKERLIICIEKVHQTSIRFPRRAGMPAKKPL